MLPHFHRRDLPSVATMSSNSRPRVTLSLGGVNFCLQPTDAQSQLQYTQTSDQEIVLELTSFTGSLVVTPTHVQTAAADEATVKVTPKMARPDSAHKKRSMQETGTTTSTKLSSPLLQQLWQDTQDMEDFVDAFAHDDPTPVKKQKTAKTTTEDKPSLTVEEPQSNGDDEEEDPDATQDTLLAPMDLSQTQGSLPSSTDQEKDWSDAPSEPARTASGKDKAVTVAEAPAKVVKKSMPEKSKETPDQATPSEPTKTPTDTKPTEPSKDQDDNKTKLTRRVSIGTPEKEVAKPVQPPPSARWGHTVTAINENRFIVYGGQNVNPQTKYPQTLNDLYVYDMNKKIWFKPFSGDGLPRQWHTSTYLPDRQLLLAFGGESAHPKTGKARTHSNVTVLDTELMVWYPPTVSGEVPTGRSGHAAALLDQELVIFGGVKGAKWLNTVAVLNTQNWVWRQIKTQGSAPKPRSYHSATAVGTNRVVIFGGNNEKEAFATVHVLEKMDNDTWQWIHPMVTGYGPCARTGHAAVLLPDGRTICIYGGWDPNDDEAKDDGDMIYNDVFLLNTDTWQWQKVDAALAKRVGHEAVCLPTPDGTGTQIVAFGGRIPQDRFANDTEIFNVNNISTSS